jgi:hypothetical protein
MEKIMVKIVNVQTGEEIEREINEEELAIREEHRLLREQEAQTEAQKAAEEAAKASSKLAIYAKLGLTEEEINILVS